MFSLPSLAPQDSYSLWYTPSSATHHSHQFTDPSSHDPTTTTQQPPPHRRHAAHHRTPLSRLRLDEEYMERRKLNIQNYGNSWLKPPGIPKTLYQQREERREMEEHQEALRREQLAQELAEAEAGEGMDDLLQGEGMDEMDGGERDLDDDVPEADNTGLTMESEDDEDVENEHAGNGGGGGGGAGDQAMPPVRAMITEMRARAVAAATAVAATRIPVRVPDDVYREAVARGEDPEPSGFDDGASTVGEEQGGMLQEEDLVHEGENYDMDMDADLDADIPDADEPSGYEHTDTEDELSSSDDESVDAGRLPRQNVGAATSMIRSDGTQTSMDLSSLISGSSQIGSSPQLHDVQGRRRQL